MENVSLKSNNIHLLILGYLHHCQTKLSRYTFTSLDNSPLQFSPLQVLPSPASRPRGYRRCSRRRCRSGSSATAAASFLPWGSSWRDINRCRHSYQSRSGKSKVRHVTKFLNRDRYRYSIQYQIPVSNVKNYFITEVEYCIVKDLKYI